MIDTCQANTMYSQFYSPNVIATGSSELGENSLSHHNDMDIGVAVIDSFTHFVLEYIEPLNKTSRNTLQNLFDTYDYDKIHSTAGVSSHLSTTPPSEILITDFFGGVAGVEVEQPSTAPEGDVAIGAGWESSEGAFHRQDSARTFRKIATTETAGLPFTPTSSTPIRGILGAAVLVGAAALAFSHSR